ncbi:MULTISPECIES: hypothetical protein [Streptomyces]|uniref:DUF2283 domain-containing protein n=1 Tax=Streptomyces ramulosus TaxID=47762 RepID=A0ABW1FS15_9ACTN
MAYAADGTIIGLAEIAEIGDRPPVRGRILPEEGRNLAEMEVSAELRDLPIGELLRRYRITETSEGLAFIPK